MDNQANHEAGREQFLCIWDQCFTVCFSVVLFIYFLVLLFLCVCLPAGHFWTARTLQGNKITHADAKHKG